MALLVAAAGLVLGPNLPGAQAEPLVELRGTGGGGDTSRITVSPLVDLKARLTSTPVTELFTVRSPVPAYWRLTALEEFDGRIWSSRGTYRPADDQLPKEADDHALTYKVVQDFRIGPLESFWLPAAYRPGRVDLEGARVNAESLTLLTEKESAEGLIYKVQSEIPRYTAADLAQAGGDPSAEMEPYLELPEDFPADVRDLARRRRPAPTAPTSRPWPCRTTSATTTPTTRRPRPGTPTTTSATSCSGRRSGTASSSPAPSRPWPARSACRPGWPSASPPAPTTSRSTSST